MGQDAVLAFHIYRTCLKICFYDAEALFDFQRRSFTLTIVSSSSLSLSFRTLQQNKEKQLLKVSHRHFFKRQTGSGRIEAPE